MTQHKLLDGLQSDAFEFTALDWPKRELRWRVRVEIEAEDETMETLRNGLDWKFSSRRVDGGFRILRIK